MFSRLQTVGQTLGLGVFVCLLLTPLCSMGHRQSFPSYYYLFPNFISNETVLQFYYYHTKPYSIEKLKAMRQHKDEYKHP